MPTANNDTATRLRQVAQAELDALRELRHELAETHAANLRRHRDVRALIDAMRADMHAMRRQLKDLATSR